jgi:hypothetical protein
LEYVVCSKTPIIPVPGISESKTLDQLVEEAIQHLNQLFGRKKKWLGAGPRRTLEDMAGAGALDILPNDWAALALFYRQRGEHPEQNMWRNSVEAVAENLASEIDKARTWLTRHDPDFSAQKNQGPPRLEPPGWRKWLAADYPDAVTAKSFWELPESMRREYTDARALSRVGQPEAVAS